MKKVKKIMVIVIAMLMVMSGAVAGGAAAKETPPEHRVAYKKTLDMITIFYPSRNQLPPA